MALSDFYKQNCVWMTNSNTNSYDIAVTKTFDELFPDDTDIDLSILLNNGSTFTQLNAGAKGPNPVVYPDNSNLSMIGDYGIPIKFLGIGLCVPDLNAGVPSLVNGLLINITRKIGMNIADLGYFGWDTIKNWRFIVNMRPHKSTTSQGNPVNWDLVDNWIGLRNFVIKPWYNYVNPDGNPTASASFGRVNHYENVPEDRKQSCVTVDYNCWLTNYDPEMSGTTTLTNKQIGAPVFFFEIDGDVYITMRPEACYPYGMNRRIPTYSDDDVLNYNLGIGNYLEEESISKALPDSDDVKGWVFKTWAVSGTYRPCSIYLNTINALIYYINSTGLRWMNLEAGIGKASDYRSDVRLGVMGSDGVIKHDEWLMGEDEIQKSDNPNKTGDYSHLPERGGGGDTDTDEESEYGGAAWIGSDSVSIDNGMAYRAMTPRQLSDFRFIIYRLKNYNVSYAIYRENAIAAGVQSEYIDSSWKEAFPTLADYTAYIYDKYGYGVDPINAIVSLTAFPCSIESGDSKAINHIGSETLYIRVQDGEAAGEPTYINVPFFNPTTELIGFTNEYPEVTKDAYTKTLCSHVITHPKDYKDFRAYAPYTRLELYIPMHGTIDLDPAVVIGKTLTVKVSVTVADGSSVATVLINGSIYQTINGQVGYSIPLSAEASSMNNLALKTLSAQGQSQRLNAVGNLIHGLSSFAGSIASGNYGGAAGSAVDTILTGQQNVIANQTVKYQIEHATDGKVVVGQPTSLNAFLVHPTCQLIWHLPLMQGFDHTVYSKTVGYKCHKTAALSSLSGYTECSNANLDNVSCTEAEKAIILEKLKSGIII